VALSNNLERYVWENYVSKEFLKDAGFKTMFVKSYDTWLYRMDKDGYYFSEKQLGKENFYRLEYVKRYQFP
jgi:hypothetical protein